MGESTRMAGQCRRDADGICAGSADDTERKRFGVVDRIFRDALVPGVVGLSLGLAQFWWSAQQDQPGRRYAGNGVHAGGIGRATPGCGWGVAGGIVPCVYGDFWSRK